MNDTASPLDALKPLAGRALEAALNRALALDPDTRAGLQSLDGRSVSLHLQSPPLALRILVAGQRLEVGPVRDSDEPDLAVRSTLGAILAQLPNLLGAGRSEQAAPVGKLRIEGDADLARRLQRLAERFDPDWQQPFTAAFGDVVGVQIAQAVAGTLRHAREAAGAFAGNLAEYVTEESRDVVPRAELDAFHDDVDTLRDDVERSAARVARLRERAERRG